MNLWDDLIARLEKDAHGLLLMAAETNGGPVEYARLLGKADGVRLALSKIREARP